MQLERKLETARSHALMDHPFFGTLLCPMDMKPKNDIETFATNGISIYYNEEYADSLATELVMGVLLHEVMHPAFFHLTRRGHRDPTVWNMACDYAINPLLIKYNIRLPDDALVDDKYDDWSADAIYNDLIEQGCKGGGQLGDVGGTGYFEDSGMSSSEKQEVENEWKQRLVAAVESCKLRGTVPGEFEALIEKFLEPKVLWGEKLRMYANDLVRYDSTWSKLNKRFLDQDIYLPSIKKMNGINKLVVAIDTSGSVSDTLLSQFGGELTCIMEDCDIEECVILYVDAEVNHVQRIVSDDLPISLEVKGRGGTDFIPAFTWVEENNEEPSLFIYLTDMYGSFPEYAPDYPVIWVAYESDPSYYKDICHFGEVIEVDTHK